ncbi:MAG: RNase adapter RapZ [Pseudomonadota bacterium]
MRLIVISGRSGSGKSTALHQLEDEGFYCIDNLPATLLPALVDRALTEAFARNGLAVCIDARNAHADLAHFPQLLSELPSATAVDILFLDAEDASLIKRFSETRRRHPLSGDTMPLAEAIALERDILEPIASSASLVVDTSQMTLYELRSAVRERLVGSQTGDISILFQSFGFKRGLPADADLVFDVRMLPNPHWEKALRLKSGRDAEVAAFLELQPEAVELFNDIRTFLEKWLPRYRDSNRSYVTIALGCTGGQHRSVYLAEKLFSHFQSHYGEVNLRHRELQDAARV